MPRNLPSLVDATVIRQDPDNYRLWVSIDWLGGQSTFLPVDVLSHGARDAVRGRWLSLPVPGTRGLVAFTRGDDRTGRWIGAVAPALPDSAHTQPASSTSPGGGTDYAAHYDGGWSWRGQDGTVAEVFADGSFLLLGAALPIPTRHTVNPQGVRAPTPFTAAERNPNPPGPLPLLLTLASGASVSVTAEGSVTVTAPAGQAVTLATAGGATLSLNADGSVSVMPGAGKTVTVSEGGVTQAVKLASGANSTTLFAQ